MKNFRFKIIFAVIMLVLSLVAVFSITSVASPSYVSITFVHGDSTTTRTVEEGDSFTLPTPDSKVGGKVYGWYNEKGEFFECGDTITPTKNTTLYCADGGEIVLSGSLPLALSKGYTYIKLNSNVTINQSIDLNDNILYLDLNGNTLSLNTDGDGFIGENSGLIIANSSSKKGQLNHVASGEVQFSLNSLISLSPSKKADNTLFVIGENVSVNANMNLVSVRRNISSFDSALNIHVFGELSCVRFIRSMGISNASFTIYDGAKVTSKCEFLFEDLGTTNNAATLTILGGDIDFSTVTSYASDHERYKAHIYGGSFVGNPTDFFPNKNYTFKYNSSTERYDFSECKHEGLLIESAPDCTSKVTLDHLCFYCDSVFEKTYENGVGHSYMPSMSQEVVNTPEETKPGIYTQKCTRCGATTETYTYPDPSTVYVTVGYMWDGKEIYKRVPSLDLFSVDGTLLQSFSTDPLTHDIYDKNGDLESSKPVPQEDVFFVELPLGVTSIYGTYRNGTPEGVFEGNTHLQRISIPVSVKDVQQYAFSSMKSLKAIEGLENITGTIANNAFMQDASSELFIDHMVVNAKSIGNNAFKNVRMITLTFGTNVHSLGSGAFSISQGVESILCEVFVTGCPLNAVEVGSAFANMRKGSASSGHQFDGQKIVFADHDDVTTTIVPTCVVSGCDLKKCTRCGRSERTNEVPKLETHTFPDKINYTKEATCQSYGEIGYKCLVDGCGAVNVITNQPKNPNNHSYTAGEEKVLDPAYGGTSLCVDPYYTLGLCICGAREPDTEENRSETIFPPDDASHKYQDVIIAEPTCVEWGLTQRTCSECGFSQNLPKSPTGEHAWKTSDMPIKVATCSTGETYISTCETCGREEITLTPTKNPNNHEALTSKVTIEPSLEQYGERVYECSACGVKYTERIDKLVPPEDEGVLPGQNLKLFGVIDINFLLPLIEPMLGKNLSPSTIAGILTAIGIIISIFVGALGLVIVVGGGLAIFFTFTSRKNKARRFKFKFNTSKDVATKSNATIAEQLAAMDLADEVPPDVKITQDGSVDEEAAWTAYVDAINKDYQQTSEADEASVSESKDDSEDEQVDSANAWNDYVNAINNDYEETMEISLNELEAEEFSMDDIMQDTVVDLTVPSLEEIEAEEMAKQAEENALKEANAPKKAKKKGKKPVVVEEDLDEESFDLGDIEPLFTETDVELDDASSEASEELFRDQEASDNE